jgi:hypothetical protein
LEDAEGSVKAALLDCGALRLKYQTMTTTEAELFPEEGHAFSYCSEKMELLTEVHLEFSEQLDKMVPSDFSNPTNAPVNTSAAAPTAAAIFVPEKTCKTKSEVKLAPPMPSVPKSAPSEETSPPSNAPVTASAAAPVTAAIVVSEKTNNTKCEEELAPPMPSVPKSVSSGETTPPTDAPVTASVASPAGKSTPAAVTIIEPEAENDTDSKKKLTLKTPP